MGKILTISVAAYNMEPYIRQCLDPLTDPAVVDDLEVYVVDDGGTDGTLDIAKEYEAKYPGTFHAVHKENGGYGSTVNYSLAHASGKYFKLLDGDDWYDTEGLRRLVSELKKLDNDGPALIMNRYYKVSPDAEPVMDNPHGWSDRLGARVSIDELDDFICGMWGMVVKTKAIQGHIPEMPEHMLYTDQLFTVYSMAQAEDIMFLDFPVYCYRIGRDGQSVSTEARIKHYRETLTVMKAIAEYYTGLDARVRKFLLPRVSLYYRFAIMTVLLAPSSDEMYGEIEEIENWLKKLDSDLYQKAGRKSKRIMLIRMFKKIGYSMQAGGVSNWT